MSCLPQRRADSPGAAIPEGNAEQSKKGLLSGVFGCCFPDSRRRPLSPVPAAPHIEPNPTQQNGDGVHAPESQPTAKATPDPHPAPLSQPRETPDEARPTKPADLLMGALGITYDVAKIVAGNFPLPGLQSVVGLVDYVRTLREVRYNRTL